MTRKVFLFLTAALCLCAENKAMSQVVDNGTTGACTWTVTGTSGNYTLTISGTGAMEDYTYFYIPWSPYQSDIKTLNIQQGVTNIGEYAFEGCGLTSVTISNSVTTIGYGAFYSCSDLTTITIPDSVTTIGGNAFFYCSSLTSVIIGNSVTTIGDYAFSYCSGLTSITIPSSVTNIGFQTFFGCSGLTSISVDANNTAYSSLANVLFNKNQTILIYCPSTKTGSYTIPNTVTTIEDHAFFECSGLTSVTIGNSVTTIGDAAFFSCSNLTSISIPNSVITIENEVFAYCTSLLSVSIGNSVKTIGNWMFSYCSGLTTITIPNSVTAIGDYAFSGCSDLTAVVIGNSVATIGNSAFSYCSSLTSITIPNSVMTIGDYVFESCNGLTSVTISNSLTTIGDYAFVYCNGLTSVIIPNSVTTIEYGAFSFCTGLTSVTNLSLIPQNISSNVFYGVNISACTLKVATSSVGYYQNATVWSDFAPISGEGILFSARANNTALGNVTTNISDGFYTANTSVTLNAMPLSGSFIGWTIGNVNWGNTNPLNFTLTQDTVIIANFGNTDSINLTAAGTLKNQPNITNITHLIITGNIDARDIQFIRDSILFLMELDLTGATIVAYSGTEGTLYNDSVYYPNNEIPMSSFYNNSTYTGKNSLTSIKLPVGLSSIGGTAFFYCSGLTSITIPNSVTNIGDMAFFYCSGLTSVTISNSVTNIRANAFSYCSGLTLVTIPNSVTIIGDYAFSNCSSLTSVTIPNSVTIIGNGAFSGCIVLTSVSIGDSVMTIGHYAFSSCGSLTSVTIPSSVTNIGNSVFSHCSSLTSISVDVSNTAYTSISGVLFNKNQTMLICYPAGKTGAYTIPNSVVTIGYSAFAYCIGLTSVTIPNSVMTIGNGAFLGCSGITSITIPNSVTIIEDFAFEDCSNLISVSIGNSVTTIGSSVFRYCSSLTSVTIPNTVTTIGDWAFGYCSSLTSITIPNAVTTIGYSAFYECNGLTSVTNLSLIPQNIFSLDVFYGVNISACTLKVATSSVTAYQIAAVWEDFNPIIGEGILFSARANDATWGNVTANISDGLYPANTSVTLNATPLLSSFFSGWTSGGVSLGNANPRTFTLTQDTVIIAEFVATTYLVTVTANNPTMGTVSGSGDYAENSTAVIGATPYTDYRFVQWNDGNTDNPRTVTVTQDTGFTATFEAFIFHVTITANNSSMGSVTGSGDYSKNNPATISATANAGYRFVQWNDGNTQNPRTVTVLSDTAFMAEFAIATQGMFHVSVTANNPSMGSVTGSGDYAENSTAVIGATPYTNYRFVQWNDGNTDNPRTVTVTQDTGFTATFEAFIFHVTVTANNPTMGIVSGSGDYVENNTATISATANTGYRFVQWNDGNAQNPRTITVLSDTAFIAEFAIATQGMFHVSVTANNPSMGSVTGSGDYATNSAVSIAATANTGYRFVQWKDGNAQNPRTITVLSDTAFIAEFAIATQGMFHVSVTANNPSMGSVTGSGDYATNSAVSIAATANIGYRFVQWNDGNAQNPRTITVTQDTAFTAEFVSATQNTFHITVLSNDQTRGTVMGGGDYAANTTTTIGAIANQGYRFIQWNDGNTDNPRIITVTRDTTFIATFEQGTAITDMEVSTIAIYPNPARDNIHITLPENKHQAVFTLYDMQGKVLIRKEIRSQDVVSVSNLAGGVYIYHVITDKKKHVGKLIINVTN